MKNIKYLYWLIVPLVIIIIPSIILTSFMTSIYERLQIIGLISLVAWMTSFVIWGKLAGRKNKTIGFYLLNFFIMYLMLIYGVIFYEEYIEYKLNQFDLDGDTFFSIEEQTPEQIRYMNLWINDLGRNLIYFTGVFYSLISTLVLFLLVIACRGIKGVRATAVPVKNK